MRGYVGSCLNDALECLLGYDPGLPDWVMGSENQAIARRFGLRYYENTNVDLYEIEPAVFVIPTSEDRAHAYYIPSGQIGEFLSRGYQILCVFLK